MWNGEKAGKKIEAGENCEGICFHDFSKGCQVFQCKGFVAKDQEH